MSNELLEVSSIGSLTFSEPQPNYTMQFSQDNKVIGTLNFNVSPPTFEGDTEGSARIFFDHVVTVFPHLLKERQDKELIEKLQALRVDVHISNEDEYAELSIESADDGDFVYYDAVVKLLGGEPC